MLDLITVGNVLLSFSKGSCEKKSNWGNETVSVSVTINAVSIAAIPVTIKNTNIHRNQYNCKNKEPLSSTP
jgi:hypothetical protein